MQSQQIQYGSNRIEFQSIPNQYPLGENVNCYFVIPGSVQPEHGDFIGLVQVGWKNISDLVSKKIVHVENVWGTNDQKLGHVMFESHMLPTIGQQQYQFVYVKNGGLVHGISKPFTFIPTTVQYGQYTTGQRSYEAAIQQWINKLKRTVVGVYGEEFMAQQPHQIQYQDGLRCLQKGLEQVLLNELEGVKSMQQGLQYIQQYMTSVQVLPQTFHQEIRKIQDSIQELEQLNSKYRQNQSVLVVPQFIESTVFKKPIQIILQGLHGLRTTVPVPVSVFVQEPITLKNKIQEIFASMPIESTWGQQHLEEVVYTVCKFLKNQEKLEQIQRELEQERILSHLRTLETVLLKQQRIEDDNQDYLMITREGFMPKDECERFENIECVSKLDSEKRIAMRLKLNQFLRDINQQIKDLKLKEQLHTTTTSQKLRQLIEKFESKSIIELPTLKGLVLDLVSVQVLSQVGLRRYYAELSGLLDEIEINLRDLEFIKQYECKPEQKIEEILMKQQQQQEQEQQLQQQKLQQQLEQQLKQQFQQQMTPDYFKMSQQSPIDKFGIDIELNNGLPCNTVYPTIEKLRRKFQELKSIKYGIDLRLTQVDSKIEQLEREIEQGKTFQRKPSEDMQTPSSGLYDFEKILSQLKEIQGVRRQDEFPLRREMGLVDNVYGSGIELLKDLSPEEILLNQLISKKDRMILNGISKQ